MSITQARPDAPVEPEAPPGPELPRGHGRRSGGPRRGRILLGCAVVAGGLYWAGWHSALTTVEELAVTAPKGISAQSVRDAAGITGESRVPAVDAAAVQLRIMKALPAVAAVRLERSLPHKITVVVTARKPFAALALKDGFVLVDSGGVPFDRVSRPRGLPIISSGTDVGRTAALAVLASLPDEVKSQVGLVRATTQDDVSLVMKDSAQVRWGSASDANLKAKVLAALLQVKAKEYDVSAPMLPTTAGSLVPEEGAAG